MEMMPPVSPTREDKETQPAVLLDRSLNYQPFRAGGPSARLIDWGTLPEKRDRSKTPALFYLRIYSFWKFWRNSRRSVPDCSKTPEFCGFTWDAPANQTHARVSSPDGVIILVPIAISIPGHEKVFSPRRRQYFTRIFYALEVLVPFSLCILLTS